MPKSEKEIAKKSNYSPPFMGGVRGWVCLWVFLKRLRHCAGFGVQSPTDYAFVREVIYERWPYALYALKLSQLLLRVSNYAQASRIGIIGPLPPVMEAHLKAGCRKSTIEPIVNCPYPLVIATELNEQWHEYISQEHIISFDLYYLGIAFYDEKRYREEHVINFY